MNQTKEIKRNLKTLRTRFHQRKYNETKGMRLNNYVGHKGHDNKIKKLVNQYLSRPMTTRKRWHKNKYIITQTNNPFLLNKNESKKAEGQLYKRRPMSQKKSNAIRESMKNSPTHYNLWRPGVYHKKHDIYENPNFPNPYVTK
jgi:hypothetical protein